MEVPVEPHCRACPCGRGGGVLPDRADGVRVADQPSSGGRGQPSGEGFGGVGQRAPAVSSCGRPVGGGAVKGCQEGGQGDGRFLGARRGGAAGGLARHPGGDEPGPRKPSGGLAETLGNGDLRGKVRGEEGAAGSGCVVMRTSSACPSVVPHRTSGVPGVPPVIRPPRRSSRGAAARPTPRARPAPPRRGERPAVPVAGAPRGRALAPGARRRGGRRGRRRWNGHGARP